MDEEKKVEEQAVQDQLKRYTKMDQLKRYTKMPARYAGSCRECKAAIRVGEPMVWDGEEKKAYCAECGAEHMLAQTSDE